MSEYILLLNINVGKWYACITIKRHCVACHNCVSLIGLSIVFCKNSNFWQYCLIDFNVESKFLIVSCDWIKLALLVVSNWNPCVGHAVERSLWVPTQTAAISRGRAPSPQNPKKQPLHLMVIIHLRNYNKLHSWHVIVPVRKEHLSTYM